MDYFTQNFLDNNLAKSKKNRQFPLGVIDAQLATAIQENLSISCRSDETVREIIRGIRYHFTNYVKLLGNGMLEQAQLGLGHSYSRTKVKYFVLGEMIFHDVHLCIEVT